MLAIAECRVSMACMVSTASVHSSWYGDLNIVRAFQLVMG